MYVVGGVEELGDDGFGSVSSVLKFDIWTESWEEVTPMPAELSSAGVCVLGSDIYIFGGRHKVGSALMEVLSRVTSTLYRLDTDTNE